MRYPKEFAGSYDGKDFDKKDRKVVLVTGGNGFLGSALLKKLRLEYEVYAPSIESCDITNFQQVKDTLWQYKPNFIIHLAARTEVEKSFYDPTDFQLVNYNGTVNLIEAAKDLPNFELFVMASTMETYGDVPKTEWKPFTEETKQYPNAPYAVAKVACEYYLQYAKRAYNFPFCILRQTNSYGRPDNDFFVVEQFITQMLKGVECNFGYREPYRNFLFVDDLIDLYLTVIKNVDLARGEIFCTGSKDRAIQISELANIIAKKLNWTGRIKWGTKPKRVGEIYYLDSLPDKAKRILNWEPTTSLSDGLDKTIALWKEKLGHN